MDMSFFTGDGFMAFLKSTTIGGGLGLLALARQAEMERKAEERPEDLLFWPEPENRAPVGAGGKWRSSGKAGSGHQKAGKA